MKREIKAEILETALRLFDESGYHAVSMRSIADALGISVGNLTYHYKRKEDLFEAVMHERHRQCRALPPPSTIAELDLFFRDLLAKRAQGILYASRDGRECPRERVAELQQLAVAHIGELLANALSALEAAGSLRPDPARGAMEQALLSMLLFGRPVDLFRWTSTQEEIRRTVWELLSLLLTEQGRGELSALEAASANPV